MEKYQMERYFMLHQPSNFGDVWVLYDAKTGERIDENINHDYIRYRMDYLNSRGEE